MLLERKNKLECTICKKGLTKIELYQTKLKGVYVCEKVSCNKIVDSTLKEYKGGVRWKKPESN